MHKRKLSSLREEQLKCYGKQPETHKKCIESNLGRQNCICINEIWILSEWFSSLFWVDFWAKLTWIFKLFTTYFGLETHDVLLFKSSYSNAKWWFSFCKRQDAPLFIIISRAWKIFRFFQYIYLIHEAKSGKIFDIFQAFCTKMPKLNMVKYLFQYFSRLFL